MFLELAFIIFSEVDTIEHLLVFKKAFSLKKGFSTINLNIYHHGAVARPSYKSMRFRYEHCTVKTKKPSTIPMPHLSCALVHGYAKAEILFTKLGTSMGLIGN